MLLRYGLTTLALALTVGGAAAQQQAAPGAGPAISLDQARRIAADHGVVRIHEIELDDGLWEIEGRDAAGAEIELDLRASDGSVVKIRQERAPTALMRP